MGAVLNMCMNSAWFPRCFLLLVLLNALPDSSIAGGIEPSFFLDYVSLQATNIVLVEATRQHGVFEAVESWKGDLRPGEQITVPGLVPSPDAISFLSYPKVYWPNPEDNDPTLQIPKQDAGSRMVLFLKRNNPSEAKKSKLSGEWSPANLYDDDFQTSVVWIDGERVYAFQQWSNPGPSVLMPLDVSESKMRDRVAEIVRIHRDLEESAKTEDAPARAAHLKSYVHSDIWPVKQFALNELGRIGPLAAATIRGMLDDDAFAEEAAELVKSYVTAGGDSVAENLNRRLGEQVKFWRAKGPSLPEGWWNHLETSAHEGPRSRYMETLELVLALERTNYSPALPTAKELSDFWKSLPALDDQSGLNQMSQECDRLIEHLEKQSY
jgi:hypothetical protein